jgi:DNA-binding response OmpR family regulator
MIGRRARTDVVQPALADDVPSTRRPRTEAPSVAIADGDRATRAWLKPLLGLPGARIQEVEDGDALERLLQESGRFDLVITSSTLPVRSGLSVLARARCRGSTTPFIVVTSVHGNLLRVFVSDADGTVLSTRVVDGDNLRNLAQNLIGVGPRHR